MFVLDGRPLIIDQPFTAGDMQYPASWLRTSTPEEKAAIGIVEVPEKPRPDDRFYWVDGDHNATPKDLDQLKAQWTAQVRSTAGSLLAPTDWYIVRQYETKDKPPADVLKLRSDIRDYSDVVVANIANVTVVEELISTVTTLVWPGSQSA